MMVLPKENSQLFESSAVIGTILVLFYLCVSLHVKILLYNANSNLKKTPFCTKIAAMTTLLRISVNSWAIFSALVVFK